MSAKTGWKRTTQVKLIAELQGFWATDLWDMHHSPAERSPRSPISDGYGSTANRRRSMVSLNMCVGRSSPGANGEVRRS
jgi:hypothetical protein